MFSAMSRSSFFLVIQRKASLSFQRSHPPLQALHDQFLSGQSLISMPVLLRVRRVGFVRVPGPLQANLK